MVGILRISNRPRRINWASPLTRGLLFAYLPGSTINLVDRKSIATVSGGALRQGDALRMFGTAQNGLLIGSGPLMGPLSNSTIVAIGTFTDGYRCLYGERGTGNEIFKLETGRLLNSARVQGVQFTYRNADNVLGFTFADVSIGDGPRVFAAIKTGSTHEVWTGRLRRPSAATEAYASAGFAGSSSFNNSSVIRTLGYDAQDTDQPANGVADLLLGWGRSLTIAEVQQIRADPEILFERQALPVFTAAAPATGAMLSGVASAVAAVYGALSTSIPLSGAAAVQTTAAAGLATAIGLAGVANAGAAASGSLTTSIPLSGAAAASSVVGGTLSGGAPTLSGAASAATSASGALSTSIPLVGAALASASMTGAFAGGVVTLAGAAVISASAAGVLSTSIRMSGSAVAQASAAGALSSRIQLAAAAAAVASVYGVATSKITLGGAAVATTTARGALSTAPLKFDISKIHPSRIAVFGGSGSRVAVFGGSGSRVSRFT